MPNIKIVFPADAGMNRGLPMSKPILCRVPRRRGDEPIAYKAEKAGKQCSPQTRG